MNISIKIKELKAALMSAGTKSSMNKSLNGVCLYFSEYGCLYIVGTDGQRVCLINTEICELSNANKQAIIPREAIEQLRFNKLHSHCSLTLQDINGLRFHKYTIQYGGKTSTGDTLEGRYPAYKDVVPKVTSNKHACYNPKDIDAAFKALKLVDVKIWPGIYHNGTDAGVIHSDRFPLMIQLIQPARVKNMHMTFTLSENKVHAKL